MYLSKYIDVFGWRYYISICGVVALFLSVLAWVTIPSHKSTSNSDLAREVMSFRDVFEQLIQLTSNPIAWANGIYAGFMFAVLTTFHGLWAQPFFIEAYHMSVTKSADFCSLMIMGLMLLAIPMIFSSGHRLSPFGSAEGFGALIGGRHY